MTRRCTIPTGSRKWSMEEMTAYLDWDKAEDKRVHVIVDDCGDGIRGHRCMYGLHQEGGGQRDGIGLGGE